MHRQKKINITFVGDNYTKSNLKNTPNVVVYLNTLTPCQISNTTLLLQTLNASVVYSDILGRQAGPANCHVTVSLAHSKRNTY